MRLESREEKRERRRRVEMWGFYGRPYGEIIIKYDKEGYPIERPVEFDEGDWREFLAKLERKKRRFRTLSPRDLILRKVVLLPPAKRKIKCRLASWRISKQMILSTIQEIREMRHFPFRTRIAMYLGIGEKTLKGLAKRYGVDLPNGKPKRIQPWNPRTRKGGMPLGIYVRRTF